MQYPSLSELLEINYQSGASTNTNFKTLLQISDFPSTSFYMPLDSFSSVQLLSFVQLFATHGLLHARLPCPSPTSRACSNLCLLSQWCHPTISCSVIPFSSHLQSFSASGSFPMSQFFTSGGQSIGVSASTSVLPMNIQSWFFRMDWLDLLAVQGILKSLLQHHSSEASIL